MRPDDEKSRRDLLKEVRKLRRRVAELETAEAGRKGTEDALRNSRKRLIAAQHIAKMGDFIWDVETGEVTWSDALFDLLGYQKSEDIDYAKDNAEIHHPDDLERVTQWLNACLASGYAELTPNEYRIMRKDGQILSVRTMGVIAREQGKSVKVFATIQDITERKKAEEKIQEQHEEIQMQYEELQVTNEELVQALEKLTTSEKQYKLLFDNMADGVAIYDAIHDGADFVFVDMNKAGQKLSQVNKENIIGKKVSEIFPAIREMGLFSVFQQVWQTGRPEHHPLTFYKDKRIEQWVENYVYKLPTGQIVAIYHDITERKRAEEAVNASISFLDSILEQSPFAMWISDTMGTVLRTNQSLRDTLNLTDEQIVGKYNALQDGNLAEQGVMPQVKAVFEEQRSARFSIPWAGTKTGDVDFAEARDLWIDVSMFPIVDHEGQLINVVCQWIDITERKLAEEEINRLAKFPAENPYPVLRLLKDGTILYANTSCRPLLNTWGCQPGQPVPEDYRKHILDVCRSGSNTMLECESEGRILSLTFAPVADEDYMNVYGLDITERKQAEKAIAENSRRLEVLLKAARSLSATLDLDAVLQSAIDSATHMLQLGSGAIYLLQRDELLLRASSPPLSPQFPDEFRSARLNDHPHIRKAVFTGQPVILSDTHTADLTPAEEAVSKAHGLRSILYVPILIEDRIEGVFSLASVGDTRTFTDADIDLCCTFASQTALAIENAHLYATIKHQAQKLEHRIEARTAELQAKNQELETFAYSVSHDLKAPLRGIDGYSRLLLEDYVDRLDDDGRLFLHNIRHAAKQMNQLIDDLLAYSRLDRQTLKANRLNPQTLIRELIAERANDMSERHVRVTVNIPFEVMTIDTPSLTQVLRNLLDNALKFTYTVAEPQIEIGGQETADAYQIWVRDNGIGFDMQYHDRIFEIFQRLHRAEEFPGTGVGLAIVRKALERLGGRAWAESEPGAGATFYIELKRETGSQ